VAGGKWWLLAAIADSVLSPGLLDHRGKPRRTALI
jgi:hypothetical protein